MIGNPLHGSFGVAFGKPVAIARSLDHRFVFHQRQRRPPGAVGLPNPFGHVVRIRDAKEPIKALPSRQELQLISQVPLADDRRRVALFLEHFGDRDFVRVQAERRDRPQHVTVSRVLVHADSLSIAAGHEARSRRRADAGRHTKMCELATFASHAIQVRSAMQRGPERLDIAITKIVAEHDNEVGLPLCRVGCVNHAAILQVSKKRRRQETNEYPKLKASIWHAGNSWIHDGLALCKPAELMTYPSRSARQVS